MGDLNWNSSRNKNETMFGSGYEHCPEFGVLGAVIFKLDICKQEEQLLFFGIRFGSHIVEDFEVP
jgi:hypothetical protein